jgi:hypothetical protein
VYIYDVYLGTCSPTQGIAWVYQGKLSTSNPVTLYFTSAGQIAGVGTEIFGSVETSLLKAGFFIPTGSNQYHINVAFRDTKFMCSNITSPDVIGDRLIVMPDHVNLSIPTNVTDAIANKYHRGSCFAGMGTHYFLDLLTGPTMSWTSANLMPVVPMYKNDGSINAIFFASSTVQQSVFPPSSNEWEPVPLPNALMCGNLCDSGCTFKGTYAWSTMHFYFNDQTQIVCPASYHCSLPDIICCPTSEPRSNILGRDVSSVAEQWVQRMMRNMPQHGNQ